MLINNQFQVTKEDYIILNKQLRDIEYMLSLGLTEQGKKSQLNPYITMAALKCITNNEMHFIFNSVFELIDGIEIEVPDDYNSTTVYNINPKCFYYHNPDITSETLRTQSVINAGEKYEIKLFKLKQTMSNHVIIEFLKSQKADFVGLEGLYMIRRLQWKLFPIYYWSLSFPLEYSQLASCTKKVPGVYRRSEGEWAVDLLGPFNEISTSFCPVSLICFNKLR
ncbi:MAG: hypothetical protein EHM58_02530 [Ignavibacteriae bacterium]|nr:MAG: hypothetical protein EHM58_02530 [Ignavibacteriota bacterium]